MAEILDLPDEMLHLIARQVVETEGGLRLWCMLSSACRRLRKVKLSSEPAYLLDDSLTTQGDCVPRRTTVMCSLTLLLLKQA